MTSNLAFFSIVLFSMISPFIIHFIFIEIFGLETGLAVVIWLGMLGISIALIYILEINIHQVNRSV